ncbi:MAG: 40S ribosomal protein S19, partial [Nanoarchaeota archaeon]|nr:40S ribosomal protein S19 [Nanoarchaeota archaeon]
WAQFVKTGASKQRPPQNPDWWVVRAASILAKINKNGPIGTNRLSKAYGSRKNRGSKPEKKYDGSRNIIRKCIQQLESAKLIKQVSTPSAGKMVTKEGRELLKRCEL